MKHESEVGFIWSLIAGFVEESKERNYRLTENGRYGCRFCISSYKSLSNLRRHMKFVCNKQPAFGCHVCRRRFIYKYMLVKHMHFMLPREFRDYRVTENGRYGCHKCISSYKNLNNLRRHLKFECNKEPAFVCQICDRRFTYKYILVRHMATHT
ncbi:hypothetical protein HUJ05_008997, partial [Dendroctonus ponderosae]